MEFIQDKTVTITEMTVDILQSSSNALQKSVYARNYNLGKT